MERGITVFPRKSFGSNGIRSERCPVAFSYGPPRYLQEFFSVARTPIASVTDMVWTLQYLQYRQIQRSLSDEDRVQKRPWASSNSRCHPIHRRGSFYFKGHYPKALSSLIQLEYVYLSIGVLSSGTTILADGSDNENMWTGECDSCMTSMYSDEEFRHKWVEKKKSIPREERPPSLKTVEWSFWAALPEDDDSDYLDEDNVSEEESSELGE